MKNLLIFGLLVFLFLGCKNTDKNNNDTDSLSNNDSKNEQNLIEPISDDNTEAPFYIISISSATDQKAASDIVVEKRKKYDNVNYLWIPDYESLSGKALYSVFLGPYADENEVMKELLKYKKEDKNAYAVLVSHEDKRVVWNDKYDIRVNDVKQKLIIIYADPKVEQDYYDGGGEDWGWFTYDVQNYFGLAYPDEVYFPGMAEWITQADQKKIVEDLGEDSETMGYILIDGSKKMYLQHNLPDEIIRGACDFFGLEYVEVEFGGD